MNELVVLQLAKQAMLVGIEVAAPLLLVSLVVGTLIGLIMAATQVQEFTLTFVPKLIAMGIILLLVGPWMLQILIGFATMIFQKVPSIAF